MYLNTTGSENTAVGYSALELNTTGSKNTGVGFKALEVTTGSDNTAIGNGSGALITTGSNNTILGMYTGNQDGLDIRTSSNNIVMSDGDGNVPLYYNGSHWYRGHGTANLTAMMYYGYGGSSWVTFSSAQGTAACFVSDTGHKVQFSSMAIPSGFSGGNGFAGCYLYYGAGGSGGNGSFDFTVRSIANAEGWSAGHTTTFSVNTTTGSNGKSYRMTITPSTFSPTISDLDLLFVEVEYTETTNGTTWNIKNLMLQW
jgi:hypothetical protein